QAVAGVDRVNVVFLRQRNDAGDVEISADRLAGFADGIRFVRLEAVQGEAVLVRVDRDGAGAEFVGAAEDADGDLGAVGREKLADRLNGVRHRPGFLSVGLSPRGAIAQTTKATGTHVSLTMNRTTAARTNKSAAPASRLRGALEKSQQETNNTDRVSLVPCGGGRHDRPGSANT